VHGDHSSTEQNVLQLPAPTAWPMVLALGLTLLLAGLVLSIYVTLLGFLITVMSSVGWFGEMFPHEKHEPVDVDTVVVPVRTSRWLAAKLPTSANHRQTLPVETFQIWTGVKGGVAGGIAMTVPAGIFSLVKYHSFWYAVNLLAAGGFLSWAHASNQYLAEFHWQGLIAATIIHGITSLLVGLLYGAMLPMYPKYPIVTAGFVVPLLFTGILHSAIGVLSPILNQRIDWFWFVISQIAFGLVCGYVVNLQVRVRTPQFRALPFAVRAGLHSDLVDRAHDTIAQPKNGVQNGVHTGDQTSEEEKEAGQQ
jgi:hypothetical protein